MRALCPKTQAANKAQQLCWTFFNHPNNREYSLAYQQGLQQRLLELLCPPGSMPRTYPPASMPQGSAEHDAFWAGAERANMLYWKEEGAKKNQEAITQ